MQPSPAIPLTSLQDSRQLFYEHFGNPDQLHLVVARHFFDGAFEAVGDELDCDPEDLIAAAQAGTRGRKVLF